VRVELTLDPPGATVELDGKPVADRPLVLPRSENKHQLRVSAPEHLSQTLEVHARADQTLVIQLKPVQERPRPGLRAVPAGMKRIKAFDGNDI
jgi:hypothetical protein